MQEALHLIDHETTASRTEQPLDFGVKAEHYAPVGEALLWTLGQGLGDGFTPEVKQAWTTAYTTLAGNANCMWTRPWLLPARGLPNPNPRKDA